MQLIKKNITLFSVLFLSLIISGFFIYMVVNETKEMNKAIGEVEGLKKQINDLNKQSPIPSKDNYEKISADAKIIAEKTKKLQQIFGRPYAQAVTAMTKELGISYEDLMKIWRETFNEETENNSPRPLIYNKFIAKLEQNKKIGKEKVSKAIQAFANTVKTSSVEPLNQANLDGCIMEALGVPRKMEPIPCKRYMLDMQDNLVRYLTKTNNDKETPFILGEGKESKVSKFTFDKFEGPALPRPDEVSYIFKHLKLIEDLMFRLKKAGITSLDAISKESLKGETKSEYLVFTYTITVTGPQNNLRKFVNSLLDAYKQNRVYVIKSMTLTSSENVTSIIKSDEDKKGRSNNRYRNSRSRSSSNSSTEKVEEEAKPGVPIIGNNQNVTAQIRFQYVIYIGDELTEND